MKYKIFISSVQKEFSVERRIITDFLRNDSSLYRFFDVFLFEDLPAKDNLPENDYLDEVVKSDIYLLIMGKDYGVELPDGISPTQKEYETATKYNKYRLAFLTQDKNSERHPKMNEFIKLVSENIVYKRFNNGYELLSNVYSSLLAFLTNKGDLRTEPFDRYP